MHQQNADRLQDYFVSRGIVAALLANPWTITWLTGYAPPIQTGPSPFEGGPAVAWWYGGELTLIASDAEAAAAACRAPTLLNTSATPSRNRGTQPRGRVRLCMMS